MPRPVVTAHRGLSSVVPENTLAAFQAALDAGFDAVELDARVTHDGEVVCLHDASIDRTTDGTGRVADVGYDEVRSHVTPAGPIPRLDDVLAELGSTRLGWNIELKTRRAARPVAELLHAHDVQGDVLVSSFDPHALAAARAADASLALGLIVPVQPDGEALAAARDLACRWINVEHAHLTAPLVAALHAQGRRVGAWTVNDEERARALAAAGVDAIITDVEAVLQALR